MAMPAVQVSANERVIDLSSKYKPFDRQIEAHTRPEKYVLYGGAAGGGKTVFLVNEMIALMLEFSENIGFIGRYESTTFMETTYMELEEYVPWDLVKHHSRDKQRGTYIEFVNGSRLYYGGLRASSSKDARSVNRIKGRKYGAIGWDEATEFPEDLFNHMAVRLRHQVTRNGYIYRPRYKFILTCNPWPGWIKRRFIDEDRDDHVFVRSLPSDNPCLPPEYIEGLRKLFEGTEGGQLMIDRYLEGLWDDYMQELYLLPEGRVMEAVGREMTPSVPIRVAVDVGGGGPDASVIVLRRGPVNRIVWKSTSADTTEIASKAAQVARDAGAGVIIVDAVGVGKGVFDVLKNSFKKGTVYPFVGGEQALNKDRFFNLKSEAAWNLRLHLMEGDLDLENHTGLRSELTSLRYEIINEKVVKLETKKEREARGLASPNLAEALIMAYVVDNMVRGKGRVHWR